MKFHLWEYFSTCVKSVVKNQTFLEFKLLLTSEQGRVTGSRTAFSRQISDCEDGKTHCFAKFFTDVDNIVYHLRNHFIPWQQRLILSNECFSFCNEIPAENRANSRGVPFCVRVCLCNSQ